MLVLSAVQFERVEVRDVSTEDKDKKVGTGTPGGKPSTDLDALKAKLGLARPAPGKETTAAPGGGQAPAQAPSAEDFKFTFGATKPEVKSLSDAELAAIELAAHRASKPLGRRIAMSVVLILVGLVLLWLGYQFGTSMGMRVLHNEAVNQAVTIRDHLTQGVVDVTGQVLASRKDATSRFIDAFDKYFEEHFNNVAGLAKLLAEGKLPPDFDLAKFKKDELEPAKTICKDYLSNVDEYSVSTMLQGQLYATELGAKLLEFSDRANKLRARAEALYVAIELVENYMLTGEMPKNLKPEVLVVAQKAENEEDQVLAVVEVEVSGTPEVDKELITKEVCEPVAMELEIPICGAAKGEPETEKRLIDTFEKKETQTVKQFRKVKVKDSEGKPLTSKFANLFKVDLRAHLMPLLERIGKDKENEMQNLGVLMGAAAQAMSDVKMSGEGLNFSEVSEVIQKYAEQEMLFTF